jgi:tetratricopeptide (TPR) repeat protein
VCLTLSARFKYLFYIDGSTSTTINQSYAYIAKRQGLGDGGIREMKRIAMNWIEDLTEEWLMIFDDCKLDDRRTELPGRGKGNIIYTSRLSSLKEALGGDCVWEVSPLTEAEAIELLLKASGSSNPSLEDQERAQAIVRELGCLPLAIDKAAVSIRDMYRSLGAYLQMLRREKVRLTTDSDPVDESVENMAVTAALELSCNALLGVKRQRGRSGHRAAVVALKILQLLSFYHHRGISVFILERAARQRRDGKGDRIYLISDVDKDLDGLVRTTADGSWDSTNFYVGLRLLWRFSFVSVSLYHMTISMHVLVQQWAQRRIGKAYRRWCLAAKILLNESIIASSKLADRQFARYQRSHLDACLATPSELLDHEPYDARLQLKLGWCYLQGKDFQQAETKLRRALYLHKMLYGNHAWGTIETLLYLAQLYHEEGFLGRSELLYLEIIGRLEERYRNRSDFLEALEHGQTDKTRAGSSEASSQGMSAGSPSSRSQKLSVRLLERVAIPKRLSRRLPEPPSKGKQVAFDNVDSGPDPSISPPSLPEGMSDVLDTLDNINNIIHWTYAEYSYVLRDQGRYANGKRMLLTMVERLEETMDKNHPELLKHQYQARRLTHPGDKAYWEQEIDKAKALSGEAREVFWNHDCIHALILGYANSLAQNKEWADAYYVLLEAEALVLRSYGYSDYRMIEIMRLQVKANIEFGKFDEAARLARECARQAEATYGKAHKETILAKQRLVTAILHQRMDFDDECRANLQDALEGALVVYGSAHSTTKAIRRMLERGREEKDIRRREVDASTSSDANTAVDTDMAATETDSRIEAGPDMETISNRMKETAESLVTRFGPEHPWGKRVKSLVDGGPVKSLEESAERFRGCFGAENRTIKGLEENLRTREANLARLLLSSAFPKTGPLIITPARWEVLKENAEKVIDLLGPGEPLSIGMKALAEGGPAKNADDFLERVREAFGWQRGITQDVEEGIRLRRRTRHPTSAIVNLESVPELGEGAAGNG